MCKYSDRVEIRFAANGVDQVRFLAGMVHGGQLDFDDIPLLQTIVSTGAWGADRHRTMEVQLAAGFSVDYFVTKLAHALESVRVLA